MTGIVMIFRSLFHRYVDGKTPTPSAGNVNGISGAAPTRAGP